MSRYLAGATREETGYNIWNFIWEYIEYVIDSPGTQYIKTPSRVLNDGFADCKGYSIFAASILKNLGIPHTFRYVSYDVKDPTSTHVYVVVFDRDSSEIIIDACLNTFNQEKPYAHKNDDMTKIVRLSGIGYALQANSLPAIDPYNINNLSAGELDLRYVAGADCRRWSHWP